MAATATVTAGPSMQAWVLAQLDERCWGKITLARNAGLPHSTVRDWLLGQHEIKSEALEAIMRTLGAWPPRAGSERL